MSKLVSPLIINLDSTSIQPQERDLLNNAFIGSIILFAHNYSTKKQLIQFINDIKCINQDILISVDHEGGRIQRFRDEFTPLPSLTKIGSKYRNNKNLALEVAYASGYTAGYELKSIGIDINFSPVVDLTSSSTVLEGRTFSEQPSVTVNLASCYMNGLIDNGIIPVIKHYPGHGMIEQDTHKVLCHSNLTKNEIKPHLRVFQTLIQTYDIPIMTSHIKFTNISGEPVSTSKKWLIDMADELFERKPFFISDDIEMSGLIDAYPELSRFDILMKVLSSGCSMAIVTSMQKKDLIQNLLSPKYYNDEYISKLIQSSLDANGIEMSCHDKIITNKGIEIMYNKNRGIVKKFNESN